MKLWQRAAGALKDKTSIWSANLSRKTSYRNPDLEAAIIKATSHDECNVDYRNAQRVFAWIRASPISLKPLVWALSNRMEKTESWVVAIKGLMLMHGVFCCKTAAVQRIGRLPFDLSQFTDGHSSPERSRGFDAFVRAYFAYLDQKSSLFYEKKNKKTEKNHNQEDGSTLKQELIKLEKLQTSLDTLLQIKPESSNMKVDLILEAMDCVIIEIFDVYRSICDTIAKVLMGIQSSGKIEAEMAVKALRKATTQGDELVEFFEFCRDFGVFNAMEVPKVTQVTEEDIEDLERIMNGVSENKEVDKSKVVPVMEEDAKECDKERLRTIVTDKWEVFDEDFIANYVNQSKATNHNRYNPFEDYEQENHLPIVPIPVHVPDLITF
ncbi:hypothetical protein ACFE04_020157 [Oxalis oulophora]